ncbi:RluA family pseudouridine synthase [Treponema primitia]|uniref:RluA family pseudouridine synthase n=1 Tax=Treponema primitia TaxID=88058 RepID=UPI00025555D2|nr:RNA pseudouridine synthase [Treponema primitia]
MSSAYPRRLSQGLLLLYEDRDLLVVDKPAGLLSIAAGAERDKTAYWILSEYLRKKGEKRRPAVVHRLDRETSGVMIFAKSDTVKRKLMEHWDATVLERCYIALAEGELKEAQGSIDAPLGEDQRGRVVVVPGGQRAVTHWKVLKTGRRFSLLSLELETGRRNQIRAHLDWLGHPVAGDKKYRAKTDPLHRLCLHAERIVFHHPHDGRVLEFEVKAPLTFQQALKTD